MREEIKFEFTHNLSDALELIAESSSELGLFRDDISYLEIGTILSSYKKFTKKELKAFLKKQIPKNKSKFQINTKITLPSIISSERDFEIIQYHTAKPNYITDKSISEIIINLDISKSTELENKIFLLDPPCKIITGKSKKMQDIVIKFLKKHDYKYMVGDAWNRGYIMVL